MTIGISKKALEEIALGFDRQNMEYACVVRSIISDCKELDPWLPIDENTPKDRKILLYWPMFINLEKTILWKIYNPEDWKMYKPTRYKELQLDPTCENSSDT